MRKIFPFGLFHLGGDEVNTGQCADCLVSITFPVLISFSLSCLNEINVVSRIG